MNLLFWSPKGMEAPSSEKLAKDGVVENLPNNIAQSPAETALMKKGDTWP